MNVTASTRFRLFLVCAAFVSIHTVFLLHDLTHPGAWLLGDRALERLQRITGLVAAPDRISYVLGAGPPGDYILHALLYAAGGPPLVIAAQILAQLLIVIATFYFAKWLGGNTMATVAGVLCVLLPGSLMNPHLLTTETFFAAFLSAGTFLLCVTADGKDRSRSFWILLGGFVFFGMAAFVRPQGMLVPAVLTCVLVWCRPERRSAVLAGAMVSFLIFPVSWIAIRFFWLGDFGLGSSGGDLGENLAIRANRMLSIANDAQGQKLDLRQFVEIAVAHPLQLVRTLYSDAINLVFNPGVNHLFGTYLGLFRPNSDQYFWHQTIDTSGALGVIREIWRQGLLFCLLFVVWSVIHGIVLLGAFAAAYRSLRSRNDVPTSIWLMELVVVTTLATAFAAGSVRWAHRSGVEALLAVLASWALVSGAAVLRDRPVKARLHIGLTADTDA